MKTLDYCIIKDKTLVRMLWIPISKRPETIIPEGIEIIGEGAFKGNRMFDSLIIPPSVREIRSEAFAETDLSSIVIPPTIEKVGEYAFKNCIKLKSVTFSRSTKFEGYCFSHCENLNKIILNNEEVRVFYFPFEDKFAIGLLYEYNLLEQLFIYKGRIADKYFPNGDVPEGNALLYFALKKQGDQEYWWYDTIKEQAMLGAEYQASHLSFDDFFHTQINADDSITPNLFSLMTGICCDGISVWTKASGLSRNDSVPVSVVLGFLQQFHPKAMEKFLYYLEHQQEAIPINYFKDGLKWSELRFKNKK